LYFSLFYMYLEFINNSFVINFQLNLSTISM
jgi:hypothetical protein